MRAGIYAGVAISGIYYFMRLPRRFAPRNDELSNQTRQS
ncbi:hypothetical protein RFEPED_0030 [Rickettsia felis str. Pedreira]|uniref:Uncharacterized protein n=1 Tax=Rickettsia felis str. Pedreira TaxID=1359196 RepID=A0A0F3MSV6_RICFI|nr:hypothetical protein RFEPED_0030 [Rickettsia felis str. Pedreira]